MIVSIYQEGIFDYYKGIVEYTLEERNNVTDESTRCALNLNIILCLACYIEGFLENRAKAILGYYRELYNTIEMPLFEIRKPMNFFYERIEEHISEKISQTTGIDSYNKLFELLTGNSFKDEHNIANCIEGINALFHLRNVVAHGRQIYAYELEAYYINGKEEGFYGGYKKVEDYLKKKKIIQNGFVKAEKNVYFVDEVADHFFELTMKFLKNIDDFVKSNINLSEYFTETITDYNRKNNLKLDTIEYFSMCCGSIKR